MTEQTCAECIRKFGLDQKVLWHCPEGKTPEICGKRFSWANQPEILEKLAELEHEQWMAWSKHIAKQEKLSPSRIKRWKQLWIPYTELSEEEKEHDRNWGKRTLKVFDDGHGVLVAEAKQLAKEIEENSDFTDWSGELCLVKSELIERLVEAVQKI